MAMTGQVFDLDPKTFTLGNMFAMQLHKYRNDIGKVTSAALKELTIEHELKKLADTWKDQKFDLRKYQSVRMLLLTCCSMIAHVLTRQHLVHGGSVDIEAVLHCSLMVVKTGGRGFCNIISALLAVCRMARNGAGC
jgi:hypothetical protein